MAVPKLFNMVQMTTYTTGAGPVVLAAATPGYRGFIAGGVVNGDTVRYAIYEANQREFGYGIVTISGVTVTMSRVPQGSTTGFVLNLQGSAIVSLTPSSDDFANTAAPTVVSFFPYVITGLENDIMVYPSVSAAGTLYMPDFLGQNNMPIFVKDAKGIAGTYPLTLIASGTSVFDGGATSFVFNSNFEAHQFKPVLLGVTQTWVIRT